MEKSRKIFIVRDRGNRIHFISLDFNCVRKFVFETEFSGTLSIDIFALDTVLRYPDFSCLGLSPR